MRVFASKIFYKWSKEVGLTESMLTQAVMEMNNGQLEANLGGCVYKKRIALKNKGKRGGLRVLVAFKNTHRAFFIYGFTKNARANINTNELAIYKELAHLLLSYSDVQIASAIGKGEIREMLYE